MATLIMGHGDALPGERITVPTGRSISFLIDEARVMPFANGVGAVMNAATLLEEGFTMSSQHEAGEEISNHRIGVLTSDQRSWYAQVDPEDGTCVYAGEQFDDRLRLCEDVDGCAAAGDGLHHCTGLFGLDWMAGDLVWVSCRKAGSRVHPQMTIGGETTEYMDLSKQAADLVKNDPDNFAEWFDALEPEQVAQIMWQPSVKGWSYRRQAREWLAGGAHDEDFYAFVAGQAGAADLYLADADLSETYERGKQFRQAREFLQATSAVEAARYARGLDAESYARFAADPAIGPKLAAAGGGADADAADAGDFGLTLGEIDRSFVASMSQRILKDADAGDTVPYWQTGDVLLVGEEQPLTYRQLVERARGAQPDGSTPNGRITVVSRGGRTSRGRLQVSGRCDQDVVSAAIAAFSQKTVTFT